MPSPHSQVTHKCIVGGEFSSCQINNRTELSDGKICRPRINAKLMHRCQMCHGTYRLARAWRSEWHFSQASQYWHCRNRNTAVIHKHSAGHPLMFVLRAYMYTLAYIQTHMNTYTHCNSIHSALHWHCKCHGFDPRITHMLILKNWSCFGLSNG